MYDFIDQRMTTLDRGGQFLVWSMRNWVLAIQNRQCPPNAIGPAFAKWGLITALPHFHLAMMILSKDGLNQLQFSPVGCVQVSDDEAMLLALFRSLRDDRPDQVSAMIDLLVPEGFAAHLLAAFTAISMRLAEGNLIPEAPLRSCLPTMITIPVPEK